MNIFLGAMLLSVIAILSTALFQLRGDIKDLAKEITSLRADMNKEITDLRVDMTNQLSVIRLENAHFIQKLDDHLSAH